MLQLRFNGADLFRVRPGATLRLPNGDVVSPALAGWQKDGYALMEIEDLPAPEPTPEEIRAALPPLTRRQVFIALHRLGLISAPEAVAAAANGTIPAALEAAFADLPQPEQTDARVTFAAFQMAYRLDPLTAMIAEAGDLDDAAIDAIWRDFAGI